MNHGFVPSENRLACTFYSSLGGTIPDMLGLRFYAVYEDFSCSGTEMLGDLFPPTGEKTPAIPVMLANS